MPRIIAILFEKKLAESFVAIQLDGEDPEILFTKGPTFVKTMGPYPKPYAEATFRRWHYCRVENPPEVNLKDKKTLLNAMTHLCKHGVDTARYCPEEQ